jgi:hypothetical protein
MCKLVVIIKQFCELSLACLCTAVLLDAPPAPPMAVGKSWLSFEEIRIRSEVRPETPSLKRPAKTYAAREAMQGEADETERLRTSVKARRGVTVVGDLV